jgi:ribosomal subunit interface protein
MPFRVSGKNIEIGEAIRERISARVFEALGKYFDGGFSGHVTVGKEAFGFQTECVVHLDSGIVLRADSMAGDAYLSADQAVEKLEKRLRRYHGRLKDHPNGRGNGLALDEAALTAPDYVIAAPGQEDSHEVATFNPMIIAESTTSLKQLSVSEAVMQLDMTGAPVMVFRHACHGRVNLVYRRADGNIGWIDPPAVPSGGH